MAIIFHKNIRNAFLYQTWWYGLVGNAAYVPAATPMPCAVTIYGGTQPSAATIAANWASYNTSFLLHLYTGAALGQPSADTVDTGVTVTLTTLPTAQTSNAAGTATWAILWGSALTQGNINAGTIPSTRFIVLPVSSTAGTAPLRMASTTIASSTAYTVADLSLTAAGGIS